MLASYYHLIEQEEDTLDNSPPQHMLMSSMHGQQDLDRNDATPPAVSNVELASTMITTILGDQVIHDFIVSAL